MTAVAIDPVPHRPPRPVLWVTLLLVAVFTFAGLIALGLWQVNRLQWKSELIERVKQRTSAVPAPMPSPVEWPDLRAADIEYRRVQLSGRFAHDKETLVAATTALGSGYWVLTPLQTSQGWWVIVNRGFVPPDRRAPADRGESRGETADAALQTVTGLMRASEPAGRMLQANQPAASRWYSRDVAAIASARQLPGPVAPFFVDVSAVDDAPIGWPRAGLTVLHFTNNHLVYAITWFLLAAMVAVAIGYAVVVELRSGRTPASSAEA